MKFLWVRSHLETIQDLFRAENISVGEKSIVISTTCSCRHDPVRILSTASAAQGLNVTFGKTYTADGEDGKVDSANFTCAPRRKTQHSPTAYF